MNGFYAFLVIAVTTAIFIIIDITVIQHYKDMNNRFMVHVVVAVCSSILIFGVDWVVFQMYPMPLMYKDFVAGHAMVFWIVMFHYRSMFKSLGKLMS